LVYRIPFAYSSNGSGFIEHDFFTGAETELKLAEFPSADELWSRYLQAKGLDAAQAKIVTEPDYFDVFSQKKSRYYQRSAIDKTIEAVAKGQGRILLVMATGTGKTYTAFQIIWKLLKTETVKRVLYLADRNILIDQTMQQDFKPFEKIMTKIQDRTLDSSYEIFMSLYHQLAGDNGNEPFRQFQPGFFDLIIVDECHRGSAKEESQWRRILEYFHSAIHLLRGSIGKTAKFKKNERYDTGFINAQMVIVRAVNQNCISYIEQILTSEYFNKFISGVYTGTAVKQLPAETLRKPIIPLPPLAEQQSIVDAIDKAFEKIKELEKDEIKLDLLQKSFPKKMKNSLLQAAIQGKLTEQLESDGDTRELVADIRKEKERFIAATC
jgi:hypothetical protein